VTREQIDVSGFNMLRAVISLTDGRAASKEAEDCRGCEDTPRYCERILRLVSTPQVRPRRDEHAHQTLRGIRRVGGYRARLTQVPVAIRGRQGEGRGPDPPVGSVQTKHCQDDGQRRPRGDGTALGVFQVCLPISHHPCACQLSSQRIGKHRKTIPGIAGKRHNGSVRR